MDHIAIFTRSPEPGRVKMHLSPPLDMNVAARLYAAFFCDCLLKASYIVDHPVIYYDKYPDSLKQAIQDHLVPISNSHTDELRNFPNPARNECSSNKIPNPKWVIQENGDLGTRILCVETPVIVLFADIPTLPVDYILQAKERLEKSDIVIGPAIDGGCYLIGFNNRYPEVFQSIPWGGSDTCATIRTRAAASHLSVGLLPPWYDVDTIADLNRLKVELETLPEDSPDNCPCTRRVLIALG